MISKEEIKKIKALHRKKKRDEQGLFLVEGLRSVEEVIKSALSIRKIFLQETQQSGIASITHHPNPVPVTQKEMARISALTSPPGILAVVEMPGQTKTFGTKQKTILLDGIKDPGNLGTIIRTAHWFSIEQIICSRDCVDVFNPKTVQASMGSVAYVPVFYKDLPEFMDLYSQHFLFAGLDMHGQPLPNKNRTEKIPTLIVGSEAFGLSEEVAQKCHTLLNIPARDNLNKPDSLNASIAAAIAIYHFFG
ncbi:MAG: RNA methyltransferase [Bacteroidales bacterium]